MKNIKQYIYIDNYLRWKKQIIKCIGWQNWEWLDILLNRAVNVSIPLTTVFWQLEHNPDGSLKLDN